MVKLHESNAVTVDLKNSPETRMWLKGGVNAVTKSPNSKHFCLTDTTLLAIFTLTLRKLISSWSFLSQFHDRDLYSLGRRKVVPERCVELIWAETEDRSTDKESQQQWSDFPSYCRKTHQWDQIKWSQELLLLRFWLMCQSCHISLWVITILQQLTTTLESPSLSVPLSGFWWGLILVFYS